jgi:hypothetical protein
MTDFEIANQIEVLCLDLSFSIFRQGPGLGRAAGAVAWLRVLLVTSDGRKEPPMQIK